ncbi:beta-glucosidase [Rubellimicrobium aerolatum]|uniref:Glycoside hydrolase family 3 C-terminal domain-containing protein n=1 Tax=Rubellimicrobium aerolatum TaxID=490979 RepID=A0ABW0SD68_9RHOB|nr:glycoside hydrolase family 3 C-terminal domain-containing protein [Rubellimicrobium aerolatum]MBP1806297.1 beta-glucosidase [Rubellimicrobium aerolatum]
MIGTRIEGLVDAMTLEEQVSLLSGRDFWSLPAIERLGIGSLRVTDGPNGARGGGSLIGGVRSAAFPVGIALGATWDPDLVSEIGAALADEAKAKGAHVLLAPTVNLHRTQTNGRNFECYSEDPVLSAELAVGYIEGLQGQGIAATVKHFVGNESEIQRTTISSEIHERTLRELYLVPFEAAVKRAGAWAVMTSYNRLGGTYTSEHPWLLTEVLRGDWGFDGVVMSDWFGSHSTAPTMLAGLDLEMPGPARDRGHRLVAAVEAGEVAAKVVRERALNVLRLMARTGALDDHRPREERAEDRPEHRALIRRAGAEGMVLLASDGTLPLREPASVAVIGPNAKVAQIMGGGSAQLNAHYRVSPWDGLAAALGKERLTHAHGCDNAKFQPVLPGPLRMEIFANRALSGEPVAVEEMPEAQGFWFGTLNGGASASDFSARITGRFTAPRSGTWTVGLRAAGLARVRIDGREVAEAWESWTRGTTFFEEGNDEVLGEAVLEADRTYEIEILFATRPSESLGFSALAVGLGLPSGDAEIDEAVEAARRAEVAVVCVGRDASWDTEGADLPGIALPGRQAELIEAVAAANPRTVVVLQTGGPVEMPWLPRVAAVLQAWYPGQEAGNAIADVLLGRAEPGGRLPQTFPARMEDGATFSQDREVYPGLDGRVRYEEGVFIGYRHHDRVGTPPLFPFGHGLSYTTFAMADLAVAEDGGEVRVAVTATNTGARAGSEVVQIYVTPAPAPVPRPARELKGFAKVRLSPGESRRVEIALPARAFARFDAERREWVMEAGTYGIEVGRSAADLPLSGEWMARTARRWAP